MQVNRINASSSQATLSKKQNLNFGSSSTLASMSRNFVDKAALPLTKFEKKLMPFIQGINCHFLFLFDKHTGLFCFQCFLQFQKG
jgi:hypothetical protein